MARRRTFWKSVKKETHKLGRGIKKHYVKKGGQVNVSQVITDAAKVASLARMLNAEKKTLSTGVRLDYVGQCEGNSLTGYYVADITPNPGQGDSGSQRNGNSIKINSALFSGQLKQMSALSQDVYIKLYVVKVIGAPIASGDFISRFLNLNDFSSMYDNGSTRNMNYFRSFKIIRTKTVKVPAQAAETTSIDVVKDFSIPIKFKSHHVKFQPETTTVQAGQIFILATANLGNKSTTTASTYPNIPVLAANTGVQMRWQFKSWYYDN